MSRDRPPIDFSTTMTKDYFNVQPSTVRGRHNLGVEYNKRLLYAKLYSVFELSLPETWAINWFRWWLFHYGSIAVIYTKEFGWVCQPYSIITLDLQYNPREILVSNPFFRNEKKGLVGLNCGIIHLMDDYFGLDDIITHYAEMLAQVERSINVNLMNSNMTTLMYAKNKKHAEELKEAYQQASTGQPLVIMNGDSLSENDITSFLPSVKNNFIVPDLQSARRSIINAFLTDIGIRNVSVSKKEHLNQSEATENNDETKAIATIIYENIKFDMDYINALSGLNLSVNLRYDYEALTPTEKDGEAND